MIRLEIVSKTTDTRAGVKKAQLSSLGFDDKIENLFMVDVFTIEKEFDEAQINIISQALINQVSHQAFVDMAFKPKSFDLAIEVGYRPGVTDGVALTAKELVEDLLGTKFLADEGIYTSQLYFLKGKLSEKEINLVTNYLSNALVNRVLVKTQKQFFADSGMRPTMPKVKLNASTIIDEVNLNISKLELGKLGKEGILNADGTRRGPLALNLDYLKTIRDHFKKLGRNPTDVELESLAQTWSEHCKHTIFRDSIDDQSDGLFKTYIKSATEKIRKIKGKSDFCVSVFEDNSGAIDFDNKYLVTHKVETHNSPSALDPFGGSITGIVGVNRDAIGFGLGAKPIINTYGFCLAPPNDSEQLFKDSKLKNKMLSPRKIIDGIVAGVNSGGNCSGIPTPQGFVYFNLRFKAKPLVFVGTVGLIPRKINGKNSFKKRARPGNLIVMVGGRVGLDGIHGATFSSESLSAGSPSTAVQIGDPITQKKMSDALVKEARDLGLFSSITDNGAGGLSCSVAEMAKESGGCEVNLESVPLKYPGLAPWQIWISESQERMTLAVPPKKWQQLQQLLERRGVEAVHIGKFTRLGKCVVKYQGKLVMDLKMSFLHEGLPRRILKTAPQIEKAVRKKVVQLNDYTGELIQMLGSLNVASFAFISSQFDHEVQGTSVLKPLQGKGRVNAEATVSRPVAKSWKGIVVSQGIYPDYTEINSYDAAACAIDTAIRNVVTAGGDINHLALLDNFCWCSSNEPVRLFQLKEALRACYDYSLAYGTPFISGKDSMFNDFSGFNEQGEAIKISIPPTLLISVIGVIKDVRKAVSLDAKFPGELIYVLGKTFEETRAGVPKVDALKNKLVYEKYSSAVNKELVSAGISVTRGGLGVALAKMAMGGKLGMEVSVKNLPPDSLFSQSQGRILCTVSKEKKGGFEKAMTGSSFWLLGKTKNDEKFIVSGQNNKVIINSKVRNLLQAYHDTFKNF